MLSHTARHHFNYFQFEIRNNRKVFLKNKNLIKQINNKKSNKTYVKKFFCDLFIFPYDWAKIFLFIRHINISCRFGFTQQMKEKNKETK